MRDVPHLATGPSNKGTCMYKHILAAAAAMLMAGTAGAATIINGSFENSALTPGKFTTLYSGSTAIDGWTVTSGSVDYKHTYWKSSDGRRSIDLAGLSIGSIAQSFATAVGQSYTVTFEMSSNPDGGTNPRNLLASIDGGPALIFNHPGGNSSRAMNWLTKSFSFVAMNTVTNLSFAADSSSGGFYGAALDNVGIFSAIPEPATWAMLIGGFGLAGAAMRRRRRRPMAAFA